MTATVPATALPFWRRKTLAQMTPAEWESLCDGCGRCCLHKLEDADTGALYYTDVACRLLDIRQCRCRRYGERARLVPDCVTLTVQKLAEVDWLPDTCAYRLLADGGDLPSWHPLVSSDPESVHRAGISVRGLAVSEADAANENLEDHIIEGPF